jgi:hydroxylamine reductase
VAKVLTENFGIAGITTVEEDGKTFFGSDAPQSAGPVSAGMTIGEILLLNGETARILTEFGMHCLGCPASLAESLRDACRVHGIDETELTGALNRFLSDK